MHAAPSRLSGQGIRFPGGLFQQWPDLGHLRDNGCGLLDPLPVELDDGVPVLQYFAGFKVADPVVGEPGSDEGDVAGFERANVVSDDELSGALPDEVDLIFWMVIPPCHGLGKSCWCHRTEWCGSSGMTSRLARMPSSLSANRAAALSGRSAPLAGSAVLIVVLPALRL